MSLRDNFSPVDRSISEKHSAQKSIGFLLFNLEFFISVG